jgi:hypothetical protein
MKTAGWLVPQGQLAVYMLLDRSGSMAHRWEETISSLNAYVRELAEGGQGDADITIALFDEHCGLQFELVRDKTKAKDFVPIDFQLTRPRGSTPLYDACGKIYSLAAERNEPKTVMVILTDGHENASKEMTKSLVKKLIEDFKAKVWQTVFLGVDFDAYGEAGAIGVRASNTLNTQSAYAGQTMRSMASRTVAYAGAATQDFAEQAMCFDVDDTDLGSGKLSIEEWSKRYEQKMRTQKKDDKTGQ